MSGRNIIVIGASAGGVQALSELVSGLPHDFPAAVFVVVHTSPTSPGVLPQILDRAGPLPCEHARDGEPVRMGRILVAPPDHHLLIKDGHVRVTRGPKENGFRPAVDPLFRSASRSCGPRTVGVVLSGGLDDGTEGLLMIKRAGGAALVQDPAEATFPSMPASAVQHVEVDQVLRVGEMPAVLMQLAMEPVPASRSRGAEAMRDDLSKTSGRDRNGDVVDVAEIGDASLTSRDIAGPPSGLTCPECGGALWEIGNGKIVKYRCHVGHSYTPDGLMAAQEGTLEGALWSALRALEESASLRRRMAQRSRRSKWAALYEQYEKQAAELEARAAVLRQILLSEPNGDGADPSEDPERAARADAAARTSRARRTAVGRPTGEPSAPPAGGKPAPTLAAAKAARRARAGSASWQAGGNGERSDVERHGRGDGRSVAGRRSGAGKRKSVKNKGGERPRTARAST